MKKTCKFSCMSITSMFIAIRGGATLIFQQLRVCHHMTAFIQAGLEFGIRKHMAESHRP